MATNSGAADEISSSLQLAPITFLYLVLWADGVILEIHFADCLTHANKMRRDNAHVRE